MAKGSCICGKTTFSYPSDKVVMNVICHCLTCRKLTGSTYLTCAMVPEAVFSVTGVKPRLNHGTHETGLEIEFYGCESCPSTLYKRAPGGWPGMALVFLGPLDDEKDGLGQKPSAELWTKYRVGWLKELEGTAQFEEFPPA